MKYPLFFIAVFFSITSFSQEEEMSTGRPDETESSALVSKGFFQVETGFYYEEEEEISFLEKTWVYNTTLLRYGLLENLELRLGIDFLDRTRYIDGEITEPGTGFSPLMLGVKIGIAEENGI